jgi:hypothetical protein
MRWESKINLIVREHGRLEEFREIVIRDWKIVKRRAGRRLARMRIGMAKPLRGGLATGV